jgi:glycine/D-amino acid oxidase-like deaminating enzyme
VAALLASTYLERCLWQVQAPATERPGVALAEAADVVVVGAGICGLSAADSLARAGRHVVVVEKEPLGWGASTRNGGMVIPELKSGPAALEKKLGALGRRLYAEVNDAFDHVEAIIGGDDGRGGIACDYQRSGQLYLAHTARHVPALRAMAREHGEELGEPVRFVERSDLASEIGSSRYHGGVVIERTGGLHPARFHAGLAERALGSGADVHDRTACVGIERRGSGHVVTTTRGAIRAGEVLVATNAYADASVPALARRVLPVGSYIIATEVLDDALARSVSPTGRMMVDTKQFLFYWRLTPDGRIAFGGRRSLDPVDVPEARDFLYDAMVTVHPQLAGVAVEYAWGGNVAITLDRLPHVGQVDGAWYVTGCNGSGLTINTWLGHRLGEVLAGADVPLPGFAELDHRAIPLRSWRAAYLPVVSRWFSLSDRR